LALRGETIGVRPGQDGVAVDDVALQRLLIESVTDLQPFAEAVPTRAAAPAVTTSAARAVASDAAVYVSAPLSLRYRGRVVSLGPRQLAAMLSVNEGDDAVAYPLTFDNPQARATLHRMFRFAETPPIDARVELRGKDVVIVPSREGFGLNMDRVLSDMDDAASRSGLRQVVVNLTVWHPTRTTQDVEQLGLSALGSEYATYYDPNNHSRSSNIIQAARLVDGAVIRPGEVFSLNATLGPRTTDRGFDYAPVIVDGVLRMGVGGGVCQFATTLFNAAFFAGLPIVERHPHDFYIEHYPVGRDASVSWGSNDLKFTNDTDHAIMIRCWAKNGELTIVLVGGTGRKVTYTTTQFYDIRPSPYTKSHPRVIYDGDLASGIVKWEHGYSGRTVKVVRTVTKDGRTLYHDTFVSSYAPKDWIKRVGTR
jgi:vancomycin resistance protein YoaR